MHSDASQREAIALPNTESMYHPRTLLFVDDDSDDLEFFREAVQSIDPSIRCIQNSDSLEVLHDIQNNTLPMVDLIFLDLNMPCITGQELLVELKRTRSYHKIPVIICTTSSQQHDITETMELGASYYLTKPSSRHELERRLAHLFSVDWRNV